MQNKTRGILWLLACGLPVSLLMGNGILPRFDMVLLHGSISTASIYRVPSLAATISLCGLAVAGAALVLLLLQKRSGFLTSAGAVVFIIFAGAVCLSQNTIIIAEKNGGGVVRQTFGLVPVATIIPGIPEETMEIAEKGVFYRIKIDGKARYLFGGFPPLKVEGSLTSHPVFKK
jgi:hypothetical protein